MSPAHVGPVARAARLAATALIAVALVAAARPAHGQATKSDTASHKTARKTVKHRAGVAKSQVAIPVSKESQAAPAPQPAPAAAPAPAPAPAVNQDSIDQANRQREAAAAAERARQDSIAREAQAARDRAAAAERARQDSIARAAALEKARQDSIAAADEARRLKARLGRYGFYWGLGAGLAFPTSDFANSYRQGTDYMVQAGWDLYDSPLGIRFDGALDEIDGKPMPGYLISDVWSWAVNADAKLRFPIPAGNLSRFYLLGGVGLQKMYARSGNPGTPVPGTITTNGMPTSFGDASVKFGYNAGAGLSFGFGRSAVFLESRYRSAGTDSPISGTSSFVPLVIGLTF